MVEAGTIVAIAGGRPPSPPDFDKQYDAGRFDTTVHGLRGMAAAMVFLAHVVGGLGENVYAGNTSYLTIMEAPWNFGRWGVWLFFVISGYVILPSVLRYAPREFALRRFVRLYPLFFFFSLIFIVLNGVSDAYPRLQNPETIVSALLMVNLFTQTAQLTPNAWSLSYEVVFYTLACLFVQATVRHRSVTATGLLVLVAAALIARYPAMLFFAGGIAVRLLDDHNAHVRRTLLISLEITAAIGCLVLASLRHYTFERDELQLPGLYGIFVSTILYFWLAIQPGSLSARLLDNPVSRYLGTVSYSLYLAHPYAYFAERQFFQSIGLFETPWPLAVGLFFLAVVPSTLALTHLAYVFLERLPYRRFFGKTIFDK
jgi:peptidoglycan/LPS O-acetylase OafA/YrhL